MLPHAMPCQAELGDESLINADSPHLWTIRHLAAEKLPQQVHDKHDNVLKLLYTSSKQIVNHMTP